MKTSRVLVGLRPFAATALVAAAVAACVGGSISAGSSGAPSTSPAGTAASASASLASAAPSSPASAAPSLVATVDPASQSTPAAAIPPIRDVALSEADNGKTVTVAVGATVELTLHNVYWRDVASSDARVLAAAGAPVYSGAGTLKCIPGTGCGTVKATYKALAAGTATITASRTTCGEVLQCTPAESSFKVTLVVAA